MTRIGENINTGYKAVDKQFGGVLPGGVAADPVSLVKDVAKDALPGHRVHGEKTAGFVANSGKDLAGGRVDLTTSRTQAGKYGGKLREHIVEEVSERIASKAAQSIAKKAGAVAVGGPVGAGIALADTANDIYDGVNVVSEIATGKSYQDHVDDTMYMRDTGGFNAYAAPVRVRVEPDIISINNDQLPGPLQEGRNRLARFRERFDPTRMDLGISELSGWN